MPRSASAAPAGSVLSPAPLVLVSGDEDLLVGRAVHEVIDAARVRDPEVEIVDRSSGELTEADLVDLGATSMFGGGRVVVVRGAQDLSEELRDGLLTYIDRPLPDLVLVLVHSGAVKNRKLADAMKAAGARVMPAAKITRPRDRHDFVVAEVRRLGGRISDGAGRALLDAVGGDLRELAAVCDQLVADTDGGLLDEAAVARFHRGRAEASGFAVADAIIGGDLPQALTLLRQAIEGGTAPVLISSAIAGGLRELARVSAAGAGNSTAGGRAELARVLRMPDWKVEKAQRAARAWSDPGLGQALRAAAVADAGVKGASVDAGYALEKLLREVAQARAFPRDRAHRGVRR
ncbi:putative DNA polymerase III subunit delta [Frankia sp. AiPs1]|uniref:DNA polymerase III subunit delta n=1 Tax=Frankia sp. AiPa1 TaxID=573492 RepID=UPI00202B90ED|nr:DNA polymerase III subunit delta [Frankia sp. AiPa1]MCL9761747.1 DNA polymerase III subunit delta [Frankia sp. AiPa1]